MTPAIDHAYPLRRAGDPPSETPPGTAEAVGHLIDGRTRGKVVITVPDRHRA
ncbi:MAG: hypothetical protein MUD13_07245 [Candidatus Nanopelagicales bacterium]|jgi:hypothetical protein|nr:hypothetical protein [Candidatus Nanopelagicales bacterium]